jgi:hypothetical protein
VANLSDKAFSSQYNYPNQKLVTSSIGTVTDLVDLSGAGYKTLTLLTSSGSAFPACLVQASPKRDSGTAWIWETVDGSVDADSWWSV